jgi:DNA-binding MarR family transcriptional regulator
MIQPMTPTTSATSKTAWMRQLETELAVLARRLEGMSRRSQIHRELDRSSYLIARTLDAEGPHSVGALADRLGLDATTVTRQVATMVDAGLVARRSDPADGRVRLVALTARGSKKMHEVRDAREARIESLVSEWSERDRREFARLVGQFNRALQAPAPPAD